MNDVKWLGRKSPVYILVVLICLFIFISPKTHAAHPGENGLIAYSVVDYSANTVTIYSINSDGTDRSTLVSFPRVSAVNSYIRDDIKSLAWSPDGTKLAFTRDGDLLLMDANGANLHTIVDYPYQFGEMGLRNVTWAPDGNSLGASTDFTSFQYSLSGIRIRTIATGSNFAWSPSANRYVYEMLGNLYVNQETFGANQPRTQLTNTGVYNTGDWSPDGNTITSTNGTVATINSDGTSFRAYSSGYYPKYSPDGNQIVYANRNASNQVNDIYVMNTASGISTLVTAELGNILSLSWQPTNTSADFSPPQQVYRFWSPSYNHHFFTASTEELRYINDNYSQNIWAYEGVAFSVPNDCTGKSNVYRFWSSKMSAHFFTINKPEKDYIISHYPSRTWAYEGVAYCADESMQPGKVPVHRFWSNKYQSHFFTVSEVEKDSILYSYDRNVWLYEGIAYFVSP